MWMLELLHLQPQFSSGPEDEYMLGLERMDKSIAGA